VAKNTEPVEAKIPFELKGKLKAIADARRCEIQDCIRDALEQFVAEEISRAHTGKRLLAIIKEREQAAGGYSAGDERI